MVLAVCYIKMMYKMM